MTWAIRQHSRSTARRRGAIPVFAVIFSFALAGPSHGAEFATGGFRFSDELGGFRILSASGTGTASDPVILVEEFLDTAPVTLIIRRDSIPADLPGAVRSLVLTKIVRNKTRRIWAGFEMELQEIRDQPSVYGDGLSFNQMDIRLPDITSDRFITNDREFEPHDRVRFQTGSVDPETTARFTMMITDPTPILEFYLVQDPQLLFARAEPAPAVHLASDRSSTPGTRPD